MRISRLAPLVLIAACGVSLTAPNRADVRVAGQDVAVVAPPGLCIDPQGIDIAAAGAFVLMADCVLVSAVGPADAPSPTEAVVSASVSTGGLPGTLDDLQAFLTGPGAVTMGKSGRADSVRILSSDQSAGVLFIKVEDLGPQPVPGAAPRFWRAFFEAGGRLIGASVLGFAGANLSDAEARRLLAAFAQATRAANAA